MDVNKSRCTGCGCCILICPEGAIDNRLLFIAGIDSDLCTECGECLNYCPNDALESS